MSKVESQRIRSVPCILIVVVTAFLAYSNTFDVPFLFDDIPEIVENSSIRSLERFLFEGVGHAYKPNRVVSYLTLALNYHWGGLEVTGYHVFNLTVHIVNALFVYLLVSLVFRSARMASSTLRDHIRSVALFSSLFFAVHPVQTQAVTYVVQRMTSLATLFYLAACCSYVGCRLLSVQSEPNRFLCYGLYIFSLGLSVAAMKTKEVTLTLPIMIGIAEFMFFQGNLRRRLYFLIPFGFSLLIIPLTIVDINQPVAEVLSDVNKWSRVETNIPRSVYMTTQACVVMTYIRLLFFPIHQNLDYDYPLFETVFGPRVLASVVVIVLLVSAAVWLIIRGKRNSKGSYLFVSFGILWFFITLSVESSVIPFVDVIFEHRVYLPSIGAFMAIVSASVGVAIRFGLAKGLRAATALGIAVLFVLGFATFHRNSIWADGVRFWEDVVEKSPGKARPRHNLGVELSRKGKLTEAIEQFQFAVAINPSYARAYSNLGAALASVGKVDDGIAAVIKAMSLDPSLAEPYYNLGRIYLVYKAAPDASIEAFLLAIRLRPTYIDAYVNLAAALNEKRRFHDSIRTILQAGPHIAVNAEAHANLAIAYYGVGDMEAAGRELEHVRRLKPQLISAVEQKIRVLFELP